MEDIYIDLKNVIEQGTPAVLCIVTDTSGSTPRKAGSKMIVFQDGSIKGSIGGGSIEHQAIQDALALMSSGEPFIRQFHLEKDLNMHCGGTMSVYFEPLACLPKLYIFGGGHIGKSLSAYAAGLGFRPYVFDQREGIFDSWNTPEIETRNGEFLQIIDSLVYDRNTYIVIVTHKHEFDEKVLLACAQKEYAYIGMIGSKRKVAEIRNNALDQNLLTEEILAGVDMPIGFPFAAETPAEIAISILAKIIDVKNTRKNS